MKLDPDDDRDDVARFCAIHEASLDRRRAIFHVFRIDDPVDLDDEAAVREALDRLAEASGYRPPGQAWRSIAEPQALRALDVLVRFDQAYSSRLVGDEAAAALVAGFAALFPEPRSWHTTATFAERQARIDRDGERVTVPLLEATGWYGMLTGATFDTGLAAVSWHRIGMLWFADED